MPRCTLLSTKIEYKCQCSSAWKIYKVFSYKFVQLHYISKSFTAETRHLLYYYIIGKFAEYVDVIL